MDMRRFIPLPEAITHPRAAEWVEWIETERENGARCLRCLRRFETAHLIPVNCGECWNEMTAEEQKSAPIAIHATMPAENEYRYA